MSDSQLVTTVRLYPWLYDGEAESNALGANKCTSLYDCRLVFYTHVHVHIDISDEMCGDTSTCTYRYKR